MAYTKAQYRTLIQQMMDDPNAKKWTAANLDLLTQLRQDALWGDFHAHQPFFTSQLDNVATLTTPGFINIANGGDLTKRWLRFQTITRNGIQYTEGDPRNFVVEDDALVLVGEGSENKWIRLGDQIHLFPYSLTDDVEARYAFYPTAYDGLGEGTSVQWPEGHEMALISDVAVWGMSKGEEEDVKNMQAMAAKELGRLIDRLDRPGIGPSMPFYNDSPTDWGGE